MNYELKLSSGKKVTVREPSIRDQDMAAEMVSSRAGENAMAFAMIMQSEIMKMLIVSINGKSLSGIDKDQLDKFFDYKEYAELQMGVKDILGEAKKPQISMVKESGKK